MRHFNIHLLKLAGLQPLLTQLGLYLSKVAQFDLGHSFYFNQPVTELIFDRLPATLCRAIGTGRRPNHSLPRAI